MSGLNKGAQAPFLLQGTLTMALGIFLLSIIVVLYIGAWLIER